MTYRDIEEAINTLEFNAFHGEPVEKLQRLAEKIVELCKQVKKENEHGSV